jgi:hypothetical protein
VAAIALLDVNILVALFDPDHIHHEVAHDWFAEDGGAAWATCPVTENGFVRVVSHPGYNPSPPRPSVALDRLRKFCSGGNHHFWPGHVSLRDESLFDPSVIASHRQLTDVYLLGLAVTMNGRLATFDRSIPLSAVKRATRSHLAVIAPA